MTTCSMCHEASSSCLALPRRPVSDKHYSNDRFSFYGPLILITIPVCILSGASSHLLAHPTDTSLTSRRQAKNQHSTIEWHGGIQSLRNNQTVNRFVLPSIPIRFQYRKMAWFFFTGDHELFFICSRVYVQYAAVQNFESCFRSDW